MGTSLAWGTCPPLTHNCGHPGPVLASTGLYRSTQFSAYTNSNRISTLSAHLSINVRLTHNRVGRGSIFFNPTQSTDTQTQPSPTQPMTLLTLTQSHSSVIKSRKHQWWLNNCNQHAFINGFEPNIQCSFYSSH